MKLLLSWVRDFVDITAAPEAIADTMALRGFEVASIEHLDADAVIDFEVTANRPDCLSVIGLAREIGTAYGLRVGDLAVKPVPSEPLARVEAGASADLRVTIEDADLCPRYAAAVADVTPTSSPAWMVSRLQACGVRPISPFVDITNYVLLERGHPMHAFDLDRLAGADIRVRAARPGETVTTLDGTRRTLDAEMLVIADAQNAQAIAGVMGGADSEVSAATRSIAFESAYFKPVSVRRTSKRLGLKTEASSRFERGADINAPFVALRRAVALMQQIGAGVLRGAAVDAYPQPRHPRTLHLRRERLASVLGISVPDADVVRILRSLQLEPTPLGDGWDVIAPTFRVDLLREVDLIEEVGRHYGFDRLDAAFPVMTQAAAPPDPRIARDQLTRRVFATAGLSEAVTFGFIERRMAEEFVRGQRSGVRLYRSPIRCRRSSTCSARHCCRDWSIRSRTIGGTGDATSGSTRSGRASRRSPARAGASRSRGRAARRNTGRAPPRPWTSSMRRASSSSPARPSAWRRRSRACACPGWWLARAHRCCSMARRWVSSVR